MSFCLVLLLLLALVNASPSAAFAHQHPIRTTFFPLRGGGSNSPPSEAPSKVIFVLGGPGAGKGTQCANLVQHLGLTHLSVGDLLRTERCDPTSPDGELITSIINNGQLVPVEIAIRLLKKAMEKGLEDKPDSVFLIDGFPRSFENIDGWRAAMSTPVTLLGVLVFDCVIETLTRRILSRGLTSGRSDDNVSAAQKRFATFHRQTVPVIERLITEGEHVVTINAEGDIDDVWEETRRVVEDMIKS